MDKFRPFGGQPLVEILMRQNQANKGATMGAEAVGMESLLLFIQSTRMLSF